MIYHLFILLPGLICGIFVLDRVGRVKTQSLLYGTAGFSVLFLGMPIDMWVNFALSILYF